MTSSVVVLLLTQITKHTSPNSKSCMDTSMLQCTEVLCLEESITSPTHMIDEALDGAIREADPFGTTAASWYAMSGQDTFIGILVSTKSTLPCFFRQHKRHSNPVVGCIGPATKSAGRDNEPFLCVRLPSRGGKNHDARRDCREAKRTTSGGAKKIIAVKARMMTCQSDSVERDPLCAVSGASECDVLYSSESDETVLCQRMQV